MLKKKKIYGNFFSIIVIKNEDFRTALRSQECRTELLLTSSEKDLTQSPHEEIKNQWQINDLWKSEVLHGDILLYPTQSSRPQSALTSGASMFTSEGSHGHPRSRPPGWNHCCVQTPLLSTVVCLE